MKSKIGLIALTFLLVFGIPFWHAKPKRSIPSPSLTQLLRLVESSI